MVLLLDRARSLRLDGQVLQLLLQGAIRGDKVWRTPLDVVLQS